MLARIATIAGLLLLTGLSVRRMAHPPTPVPATAPPTVFSAERAMRHVRMIAQRPHAIGSRDHDRVRDYIMVQLVALGLSPQIQRATAIGTRYQEAGRVQNVMARLPGAEPGGRAILLMAHYDGVEAGPAAGDDASGSAAVLETLRALRASNAPLRHDVIALFTDGEEPGLLGAAAFVREHPWAKEVDFVLNFEARGTTGRSFMFETGPGNLDAARALREAGDVTSGSVFTTIYRALPNDTDLSEIAVLGLPALNFAFADGVDRYHTSHDDVGHLNPGSVQHHGAQMLALTRELANGPLPRPKTGDGVFFDLPLVGLVVYPESWALPLAIIAFGLVCVGAYRARKEEPRFARGVTVGFTATLIAAAAAAGVANVTGAALVALHARLPWGGSPEWAGIYVAAIAALAVAIVLVCRLAAGRWGTERALYIGALLVWALATVWLGVRAPGVSYLFTWPAIVAAAAALTRGRVGLALGWLAAAITLFILAGFAYGVGSVMLGLTGTGAVAVGLLAALVTWLLLPLLEPARWTLAAGFAGFSIILIIIGAYTVRRSDDHPVPSSIIYAIDADSATAWLATPRSATDDAWTRAVLGGDTVSAPWLGRILEGAGRGIARRAPRVPFQAPSATMLSDATVGANRELTLRVKAPAGAISLQMLGVGAPVLSASIDGRSVDTTRYRQRTTDWTMQYWAVPDSGAVIALTIPSRRTFRLELAARLPGIPSLPGVSIRNRPPDVVPVQWGDVTIVFRRLSF